VSANSIFCQQFIGILAPMTSSQSPEALSASQPDLLANRYQVIRVLGEGGFGTTYLASDMQMPSNRYCVVKRLKPIEGDPQIYQMIQDRFQREAAILESLGESCDQIPSLYAYFAEGDQFYLVEEWIEGSTLTQKAIAQGPMREDQVREILLQLLPVLDYIHRQQKVHRDIKPDNILLRTGDGKAVLIDFGAVKETMGTVINSQGSSQSIVVGTPGFMPPEQMAGRPVFGSDLYSLGLTAIYLLTRRLPAEMETDPMTGILQWRSHAPAVSDPFAQVLDKAIQLQAGQRFVTAPEMQFALEASRLSPQPASAPPNPAVPSPGPAAVGGAAVPGHPATVASMPPGMPVPSYPPGSYPQGSYPSVPPHGAIPGGAPIPVPLMATPSFQSPTQVAPQPLAYSGYQRSRGGDWKKAIIIGGMIGSSILGGAMLLRAQLPALLEQAKESPSPSPSSAAKASPSPAVVGGGDINPPPVAAAPAPPPASNANTNATVVGEAGRKNLRSGPGTDFGSVGSVYPGDRIQIISTGYESNGFAWYQVYAPAVGSTGWIANHLVNLDSGAAPAAPAAPAPKTPPRTAASSGDATVIGGGVKNIRSGPGTDYGVVGSVATGDRVKIVGSNSDRGGYVWYRVSYAGGEGWIAAQLLQQD
jgi:serine/threonine protein kinase, bacterial